MLLATTLLSTALSLSLLSDGGGAYEMNMGKGRVDGKDFDIAVLGSFESVDALALALSKKLQGTATITPGETPHGTVLMIARMKSDQCPTCPAPSLFNIDQMQKDTLSITVLTMPGAPPMAMASRVGDLLDPRTGSLSYEGTAFRALKGQMTVHTQSTYSFGRGRVHSAVVDADPDTLRHRLADGGFREVEPSARPEAAVNAASGPRVSLWTNGGMTVGLAWLPGSLGKNTKVVISETASE